MPDADPAELLRRHRRLVVVGASRDPEKDAHRIPRYMVDHGYDVVPVNPHAIRVLDRPSADAVTDVPGGGMVAVFRPGPETPPFVRDALAGGAEAIWLPLGVVSAEARRLAEDAGVPYVEDVCLMVEHRRTFGDAPHPDAP